MTLAVLLGVMLVGHWFWSQVKACRVLPAIGCAVLFLVGTYMCVFMAAGRNAEAIQTKNATARKLNSARASLEVDVADAKKTMEAARAKQQGAVVAQEQATKALQIACASKASVEIPKDGSTREKRAARADLKAETEAGTARCGGATRAAELAAG